MPIVKSNYKPPWIYKNGHFSTIYSAKLRPNPILEQERERFTLPDGDFIDVDWSFSKNKNYKLAILLHGLEGNAQRTYMKGAGRVLKNNGWTPFDFQKESLEKYSYIFESPKNIFWKKAKELLGEELLNEVIIDISEEGVIRFREDLTLKNDNDLQKIKKLRAYINDNYFF